MLDHLIVRDTMCRGPPSWQRAEKREAEEIKCFSQLSIWRGRKSDMVDLNTFSIISKQEVSPAAVFWWGGGCS